MCKKKRGFLDCVEFRKIKSCFQIKNLLRAFRKYIDAPTLKVWHPVRFSFARYRATKLRNWGVWGEYCTDPACVSYTKAMRHEALLTVLTSRRFDWVNHMQKRRKTHHLINITISFQSWRDSSPNTCFTRCHILSAPVLARKCQLLQTAHTPKAVLTTFQLSISLRACDHPTKAAWAHAVGHRHATSIAEGMTLNATLMVTQTY